MLGLYGVHSWGAPFLLALRDGGRLGNDGTKDEASAASCADAKVDVEAALEPGSPIDARARGVELPSRMRAQCAMARTFGADICALPVAVSDEVRTGARASRVKIARLCPGCAGGESAPFPWRSRAASCHAQQYRRD